MDVYVRKVTFRREFVFSVRSIVTNVRVIVIVVINQTLVDHRQPLALVWLTRAVTTSIESNIRIVHRIGFLLLRVVETLIILNADETDRFTTLLCLELSIA